MPKREPDVTRIELLGPLRLIARDEVRHPMSLSARERTVLTVLALRVPHSVTLLELREVCGLDEFTSDNALSQVMSALRQFGIPIPDRTGGNEYYSLDMAPDQVDAVEFTQLVASLSKGETDQRDTISRAAALWQGEPEPPFSMEVDRSYGGPLRRAIQQLVNRIQQADASIQSSEAARRFLSDNLQTPPRQERILVVDDTEATAISAFLAGPGVEVVEATTTQQAIEFLSTLPTFDLAIVDLHFTDHEDGRGQIVLERLRDQHPCTSRLVVSKGPESARELEHRYGVLDFIAKGPSDSYLTRVHSAVRRVLDRDATATSNRIGTQLRAFISARLSDLELHALHGSEDASATFRKEADEALRTVQHGKKVDMVRSTALDFVARWSP